MVKSWPRSLKYRVPLLVFGLFLVLSVAFMTVVGQIVSTEFAALERESVVRDVARVRAALESLTDQTNAAAGDWAHWDATYDFIRTGSPAYVRENLTPEALQLLGVDEIVYFGLDLTVRKVARATGDNSTPLGTDDAELFAAMARRLKASDPNDSVEGVLALHDGPAVVALQWITPSVGNGGKNGVLAMVRTITLDEIEALGTATQLDAHVSRPSTIETIPEAARPATESVGQAYTAVIDQNTIVGWATVPDPMGDPAAFVSVTEPRTASVYASRTVGLVGWGIVVFVGVFGIFLFVVLDLSVLRRLTRLHEQVMVAGASTRESRRVDVEGADEVSDLAGAVNRTLDRLGETEEALQRAADDDYLTGLRNRRRLAEDAAREFAERSRSGGHCALILLDLDGFKRINDTFGHPAGDEVLVHFARILRGTARAYSTVARTGGDEFAVFLPHADEAEARSVVDRLLARIELDPPVVEGVTVPVAATVSFAVSPEDGDDLEELTLVADRRLYQAKSRTSPGGNRMERESDR